MRGWVRSHWRLCECAGILFACHIDFACTSRPWNGSVGMNWQCRIMSEWCVFIACFFSFMCGRGLTLTSLSFNFYQFILFCIVYLQVRWSLGLLSATEKTGGLTLSQGCHPPPPHQLQPYLCFVSTCRLSQMYNKNLGMCWSERPIPCRELVRVNHWTVALDVGVQSRYERRCVWLVDGRGLKRLSKCDAVYSYKYLNGGQKIQHRDDCQHSENELNPRQRLKYEPFVFGQDQVVCRFSAYSYRLWQNDKRI